MNTSRILLSVLCAAIVGSNVVAMEQNVPTPTTTVEDKASTIVEEVTENIIEETVPTTSTTSVEDSSIDSAIVEEVAKNLANETGEIIPANTQEGQGYIQQYFGQFVQKAKDHPYYTSAACIVITGGTMYLVYKTGAYSKIAKLTTNGTKKVWKYIKKHPYKVTFGAGTLGITATTAYYFRNGIKENALSLYDLMYQYMPSQEDTKAFFDNKYTKIGAGITGAIAAGEGVRRIYNRYYGKSTSDDQSAQKENAPKPENKEHPKKDNTEKNSSSVKPTKAQQPAKKAETPKTTSKTTTESSKKPANTVIENAENEIDTAVTEEVKNSSSFIGNSFKALTSSLNFQSNKDEKAKEQEIKQARALSAFVGIIGNPKNLTIGKTIEAPQNVALTKQQVDALNAYNEACTNLINNSRIPGIKNKTLASLDDSPIFKPVKKAHRALVQSFSISK